MSVMVRAGPSSGPLRQPGRQLQRERAFRALFPPQHHVLAASQASPAIEAPLSPMKATDDSETLLAKQEAAWSILTKWLTVSRQRQDEKSQVDAAVEMMAAHQKMTSQLQFDPSLKLREWYAAEVSHYFRTSVDLRLQRIWPELDRPDHVAATLHSLLDLLMEERTVIIEPVASWLASDAQNLESSNLERNLFVESLQKTAIRAFHIAVRRSMTPRNYMSALSAYLTEVLSSMTVSQPTSREGRPSLRRLRELHAVGLGSDIGEAALACAVQNVMCSYANGFDMRVDWIHGESKTSALTGWVDQRLRMAIMHCLSDLTGSPELEVPATDVDVKWPQQALNILGTARLDNLLSYVQLWPRSIGAILDLKEYSALPDAKQHLALNFIHQMEDRIGHAGITTAELLTIYVAMIRVFKTLDNRSVLLEKVAQPLRNFLRDRPDTVKVIAASFLAELDGNKAKSLPSVELDDVCLEITREVAASENSPAQTSTSLDWDDMTWLPDPIDAGPDYRTSKTNDIISYMLTLFDKETFVNEIQNILGERLLRSEGAGLENEIRLVEMLKSRLGADKLQSAEVMVRDMSDSARIMKLVRSAKSKLPHPADVHDAIPDNGISFSELVAKMQIYVPTNQDLKLQFINIIKQAAIAGSDGHLLFRNPDFQSMPSREEDDPRFEAKILSSFFWPELRDDNFKVPETIENSQKDYESGFKHIKSHRRLHWLSALGRATVELELEDRKVKVDGVKTWVVAVIHAFQDGSEPEEKMEVDGADSTVRMSISEIEEQLNMDEVLVRNAVSFWVGHRVLREVDTDVFEVMETLPKDGEEDPAAAATQKEEAVSALKSQNAVLRDNKPMYEMFIVGMLTNGGAMDVARVAMMLKMVVPGGFNFGEEEVTWLLQSMETDGRVERRGDTWVIKK